MTTLAPLRSLVRDGAISYGIVQPGAHVERGVPVVRVADLIGGRVSAAPGLRVDPLVDAKFPRTRLEGGEVLISVVGSVGECAVVPPTHAGWNVARAVAVLRPSEVEPEWLFYALQIPEVRHAIHERLNTTVQPTLNLADLKEVVVPVPAVEERRAIIGILGALDDKIAANDRVVELAMRLVRDLARQHAGIETFPLSGITSVVARGRAPKYVEASDCMVVNQKCVRNGLVDLAPARFTARVDVGGDRALRPLDVLINSTGAGTLGRVGIWNQAREATIDSHVTLARIDPERANPAFVAAQLIGRELAFELLGEGSTGQTELARGRVLEFPVSLPDRQTQDWVGDQIRVLLDRVQASAAETRRLAVARDALLPELMSGRLGVLQSPR